jgi:hypothetical protein
MASRLRETRFQLVAAEDDLEDHQLGGVSGDNGIAAEALVGSGHREQAALRTCHWGIGSGIVIGMMTILAIQSLFNTSSVTKTVWPMKTHTHSHTHVCSRALVLSQFPHFYLSSLVL